MSEEKENNTNTKKKNLYSCLKPYKSLFLSKNQKLNYIGYFVFFTLFLLILSFQNCKGGNIDTGTDVGASKIPDPTQPTTPTDPKSPDPVVDPNSPPLGSLIAYLSSDTEKTPKDEFDAEEQVILEFIKSHRSSDSFQWTISRGFETIDAKVTTQSNYETSFSQKGAYDILSTSHIAGDSKVLSRASKRLTIGEECDPSEILEIKVGSGSLVKGQTVTLELENSQLFNTISWKIQQDSQTLLEQTQQTTATVSLPEQGGSSLIVEVTAVSSDSTRSECMIYRKKELQVNENAKPHFDMVRPVDDTHPVTLENNDIYKYKRTSQSKYIEILITSGTECSWNENSIACNNGQWDITREDLDNISECSQAVNTLDVSYSDSNNDSQEEQRRYYKFCPKDQDVCYFGPSYARPVHHYCDNREIATVTTTTTTTLTPTITPTTPTTPTPTTTPTPQSACSSVQTAPDYKDVNGQCLKSCHAAGGTHTGSDCDPGEGYDLVRIVGTYEDPCCRQIPKQAVNGQCNNNNQNTCVTGTAAPQASSGGFYRWYCNGDNGGANATNCQKAIPSNQINGVCNNNILNGCSPGNAVAKTPSGGVNRWDCQGINGGTNATGCQKAISVNGICNTSIHFKCISGNLGTPTELPEAYTWHCTGVNGGITAGNCRKDKLIDGQCNNDTKNACLAGTSVPQTASGGFDRWHCNSSNGGTNATNCQKAQPVNGQCDNTQKNGCLVGTAVPQAESNGFYNWHCEGEHGGSNATTCKLIAGSRCNYPDTIIDYINSCRGGTTFSDRIDDNDYYKWACGDEVCERLKPFHAQCGTTEGQCARGEAGTVSSHIEDYAQSGYYILPELPNPEFTSRTLNNKAEFNLSTLDKMWSCEGGASKVYCRQRQYFDGQCPNDPPEHNAKNDFVHYCKQGYVTAIRTTNLDEYQWSCYQSGRGQRDTCTRQKTGQGAPPPASQIKSQGECSATANQCRGGTVENRSREVITYKLNSGGRIFDRTYSMTTWDCVGSGSSATTQSCTNIGNTVILAECNDTVVDSCAGGVVSNLEDSDTHYRWLCFGQGDNLSTSSTSRRTGNVVYCSKPRFQVIEDRTTGEQVIHPF